MTRFFQFQQTGCSNQAGISFSEAVFVAPPKDKVTISSAAEIIGNLYVTPNKGKQNLVVGIASLILGISTG